MRDTVLVDSFAVQTDPAATRAPYGRPPTGTTASSRPEPRSMCPAVFAGARSGAAEPLSVAAVTAPVAMTVRQAVMIAPTVSRRGPTRSATAGSAVFGAISV